MKLPGPKEGCPIDVGDQFFDLRSDRMNPQAVRANDLCFFRRPFKALLPGLLEIEVHIFLLLVRITFTDPRVLAAQLLQIGRPLFFRYELLRHSDSSRCIVHMHHTRSVLRLDLDGRMCAAGGGTSDEQRNRKALTLHFFRNKDHLIQ